MMQVLLPYVSLLALLVATISLILNGATFRRNGQWKDQAEAKALIDTVTKLSATVQGLGDSSISLGRMIERLDALVREHDTRLAAGEERFKGLATKADIARLEGEIGGMRSAVDATKEQVSEIRRWLMQESKS